MQDVDAVVIGLDEIAKKAADTAPPEATGLQPSGPSHEAQQSTSGDFPFDAFADLGLNG